MTLSDNIPDQISDTFAICRIKVENLMLTVNRYLHTTNFIYQIANLHVNSTYIGTNVSTDMKT